MVRMNKILVGLFIGGGALLLLVVLAYWWVERSTRAYRFQTAPQVPESRVVLVLGTRAKLVDGRTNLYFAGRIETAAQLYQAGKALHFILSGDNSRQGYNEPEDMRKALIKKGVPAELITLDYAGFRTLDSVVRCKEVFQQEKITIISQGFHVARACFIAQRKGLDAIGLESPFIAKSWLKLTVREALARVRMVLDLFILQTKPKYLGPPVSLY